MNISMQQTECCSESRMRSRTSRGVPEWSGGKDLYIGSLILVAGKVSHFIGIVPGVPKGVRGSTKGSTYSGGPHGLWGVRLGLYGPREPAPRGPCAKETWGGENPKRGRHLRGALGRMDSSPPLGRTPSLEEGARLRPPSPLPLYKGRGGRGGRTLKPLAPPLPATPPPPPVVA